MELIACKRYNNNPERPTFCTHGNKFHIDFIFLRIIVIFTSSMLWRKWKCLKGKFPQTTMWIGWVESNFTNPTVKVWADLDNPFKRNDYAKLCMLPSLDGTVPEYVISQEDNSPLTLYIDFHKFRFFLDINSSFDQVHS